MKIKIVNVVVTSNLYQRVNIYELKKYLNIIYDTAIYGGRVAYFKSPEMTGKVTVFPSGKLISVGTTSEADAIKELESCKNFLMSINKIEDIELYFKIQNIVAVVSFDRMRNFESIIRSFDFTYEPEQFAGGILKMLEPYNATALIFRSGKAVITGLKSEKQVEIVSKKIKEMIDSCNLRK